MRFRNQITVAWVILAALFGEVRADVSSTQKALSEIKLWDGPATPAFAELLAKGYEVAPDLLAIADDSRINADERISALRVLGEIARRNRTNSAPARTNLQNALPVLVRCLNSPADRYLMAYAAQGIGAIGDYGKPAIPDLIKATKSPHQPVRALAIQSLGQFGLDAQEALPALKIALEDEDLSVRTIAAQAIGRVSPRQEQKTSAPDDLGKTPPSESGPVRGFEVSGTFELVLESVTSEQKGKFWAAVEGQKWRVRVQDLKVPAWVGETVPFAYQEAGANDANEHFCYTCSTNKLLGVGPEVLAKVSVGFGSAWLGQVPNKVNSTILPPIWLAYCSSNYLATVRDDRLLPIFLNTSRPNRTPLAMPAEWTISEESWGLPLSVVYYKDGFTNAVFRVLSFRKVGLQNIPESSVLERYSPKDPSASPKSRYELSLVFRIKFQTTNFRAVSGIGDGRPSFPGQVQMSDYRFPDLGQFDYVITNGKWPTTQEIRGRADFKKAGDEQREQKQESVLF